MWSDTCWNEQNMVSNVQTILHWAVVLMRPMQIQIWLATFPIPISPKRFLNISCPYYTLFSIKVAKMSIRKALYESADGFWVACGKNQPHMMGNTPCKEIHVLWFELRPTACVIWCHNKNTHERARLWQHMMNHYGPWLKCVCVCFIMGHVAMQSEPGEMCLTIW